MHIHITCYCCADPPHKAHSDNQLLSLPLFNKQGDFVFLLYKIFFKKLAISFILFLFGFLFRYIPRSRSCVQGK